MHLAKLLGHAADGRDAEWREETADADDAAWLSDDDEEEELGSDGRAGDAEEEAPVDFARLSVKFGRVAVELDEVQFKTHCGNATSSEAGGRGSTMDLTELFTFLRAYALVPQMLSKTEVVKCFRLANQDHRRSQSADTSISELDFREFIDCMSRLQRISDERGHSLGDPMMDSAATMIQARVRGGLRRKELNKGRKSHAAEQGSAWMLSRTPSSIKQTFSAEEVDKIKRMQVRVRNRQLKRQQEQRHALKRLTSVAPGHAKRKGKHKAIAGRVHKGAGMVGAVQRCLMQVFDSAQVCLPPSSHRDPIREKTVHLHSPRPSFSFSPRATAGLLTPPLPPPSY